MNPPPTDPTPDTQPPAEILVESGVSYPDFRPFVTLRLGDQRGQLDPAEARQHALLILEAADAAESDAFIVQLLEQRVDMRHDQIARVLADFRTFRAQVRGK
jgi:hypothetical protein